MAAFRDIERLEDMSLDGRRVLVRVDFDCPVDETGYVTDDSRIQLCLPTIRHLISEGARVVLASSFGSPGGRRNSRFSMTPVGERLAEILDCEIYMPEDTVGEGPWKVVMERVEGEVVLLENLGFHAEDVRNDDLFAQRLCSLADVYVNEAFRLSDKVLASTVGVTNLFNEKVPGLLFRKEVEVLSRIRSLGDSQVAYIFGGADYGQALDFLSHHLGRVQRVMLGGAAALPFYAARGWRTGVVQVDRESIETAGKVLSRAELRGVDVMLPQDLVVIPAGAGHDDSRVVRSDGVSADHEIVDIGPATVEQFCGSFRGVRNLVWHGCLGTAANGSCSEGTGRVARAVIRSSASATVLGDDMAGVVSELVLTPFFAHVSSGGDVGMKMLLGRDLPGLNALTGGV